MSPAAGHGAGGRSLFLPPLVLHDVERARARPALRNGGRGGAGTGKRRRRRRRPGALPAHAAAHTKGCRENTEGSGASCGAASPGPRPVRGCPPRLPEPSPGGAPGPAAGPPLPAQVCVSLAPPAARTPVEGEPPRSGQPRVRDGAAGAEGQVDGRMDGRKDRGVAPFP